VSSTPTQWRRSAVQSPIADPSAAPGWFSQRLSDVPAGEDWLGPRERAILAGQRFRPRRLAWRLGRWTAKLAISEWTGLPLDRFEVLPAGDGAPEAWADGEHLPVSVSISHREDRAVAVLGAPPMIVGCDLELIEPRSSAFVREWLAPAEQELVASCAETDHALMANLVWTGKEAAAKVRREGLRLDVRAALVSPTGMSEDDRGEWRPIAVAWAGGADAVLGWWRAEPAWVMTVLGDPPPPSPHLLCDPSESAVPAVGVCAAG
jgi:4'-phosphopantetheinyl transferase